MIIVDNIKIGDYVLCIYDRYQLDKIVHKKDEMYLITDILNKHGHIVIELTSEIGFKAQYSYESTVDCYNFYDHFSLKELRKRKLNKLLEKN